MAMKTETLGGLGVLAVSRHSLTAMTAKTTKIEQGPDPCAISATISVWPFQIDSEGLPRVYLALTLHDSK
jgi:hypothetical protein